MKVYKLICPFHGMQQGIATTTEREVETFDKKLNVIVKSKKKFDAVRCSIVNCEVIRLLSECDMVEEVNSSE